MAQQESETSPPPPRHSNNTSTPTYHEIDFSSPTGGPQAAIQAPQLPAMLAKTVTLRFENHSIRGTLWLLTPEEFGDYHSRFFDILPSTPPYLHAQNCQPWVLLHALMGKTWCDGPQLPQAQTPIPPNLADYNPNEPTFIALTDNADLWQHNQPLGVLSQDFTYTPASQLQQDSNDVILALASHTPFPGNRPLKPGKGTHASSLNYPPLPIAPHLHNLIHKIRTASQTSPTRVPKKTWIAKNLAPHLWTNHHLHNHATGILDETSPLFRHRGNEAIFPRKIWTQLCLETGRAAVEKAPFDSTLPAAYWQVVFAELQGRERGAGGGGGGGDVLEDVDLELYFGRREPGVSLVAGNLFVGEGGEGVGSSSVEAKMEDEVMREDSGVDEDVMEDMVVGKGCRLI